MIQGCIQNDRLAQERLYRYFFEKMFNMCMRHTHDVDLAQEILNIGFLKVFQKIHTYQAKGSFEGWIRRIVFHAIADHYRSQKNDLNITPIEDAFWMSSRNEVYDALFLEDLLNQVDLLPTTTQLVFKLFAIEGYKHEEIAEVLSISSGTSKWHLNQARTQLKQLLAQNKDERSHG